jgi:hypothetical protein
MHFYHNLFTQLNHNTVHIITTLEIYFIFSHIQTVRERERERESVIIRTKIY